MFTLSMIVVGALIYFVLLAATLVYVARVSRSADHRENALHANVRDFPPQPTDEHLRRAA